MLETIQLSWRWTLRNMAIYRKDFFANILPTIFEPIFFMMSLGIGLGAYVSDMDGLSYTKFMAPGLAVATAMFTAFFETSYNFYVRLTYEGVYKAALTTPIGYNEILLGECFWIMIKGALMCTGVSLIFAAFSAAELQYLWLMPFVGALLAISCAGLGIISTALVRNINQFQTVYTLLISPMFFFSGIFFPVSQLPSPLQTAAHIFPLYHGVALSQAILWNRDILNAMVFNGGALLVLAIVFIFVGRRLIIPKLHS